MRTHTKVGLGLILLLGCIVAVWWLRRMPEPLTAPRSTAVPVEDPQDPPSSARSTSSSAPVVVAFTADARENATATTGGIATLDLPSPAITVPPPADAPADQTENTATPISQEMLGTHRMVLAHAPLRVPEVADPDSAANREILQTMITKALRRANEPAPQPATTTN